MCACCTACVTSCCRLRKSRTRDARIRMSILRRRFSGDQPANRPSRRRGHVANSKFLRQPRANDDLQEIAVDLADSLGPSSETTSAIHPSDRKLRKDRVKLCDGLGQITLIDLELEPVSVREVI